MVSCREQLSVSIICIFEFSCFLVYYCTLFSVLCISSYIHPRGFMGCPVLNIHWLLTIVSQHLSSCSALSLLERMEDGPTADFNFLCFLTTIQLFMMPPYTSHSCFILEHLGSTSHRVILSRRERYCEGVIQDCPIINSVWITWHFS